METKERSEPQAAKPRIGKTIAGWIGYLAILGLFLFFFAPESWWQFGVSPSAERKAPGAFALNSLDGTTWDFAEKRGKVVVVNYWATWCGPCRFETPGLISFSEEFRDKGVEVVGVTLDDDISLVQPFIDSYKITYPILLPGQDPNLPQGDLSLPMTFLYDKNGRLAKRYTGIVLESTLRSDASALLSE